MRACPRRLGGLVRLVMVACAAVPVALAGCGGDETPTEVAVELACARDDGARVQVDGFLRLPERIALTDRAAIDLFTRRGGDGDRVSVEFVLGSGPNQLQRPEADYTATSLRVYDLTGEVVTLNDRVTVVAKVGRQGSTCVLREPVVTVIPAT